MNQDDPFFRAETGPMQFEGDWTGVFFRGDNALIDAFHLGLVLDAIEAGRPVSPFFLAYARSIQRTLMSCDERGGPEVQQKAQKARLLEKADYSKPSSSAPAEQKGQ